MKNALAIAILLPLSLILMGCGSSPDSLIEDLIDDMNELAEAIEDDAPESELEAIGKRMEKTGKKLEELDLSEKEQKRLKEKYEDDMRKALSRLMEASMGKAGREFGRGFPAMPKFGN